MQTIDVPPAVYGALNVPEDQRDDVRRQELAVSLYREEIRSFGKTRELANLSHKEFHDLLGERKIVCRQSRVFCNFDHWKWRHGGR